MPVVHISDLSWGGEGIGRIDGKVIFIPFSLPREVVEVEVVRSKKQYSQGKLLRILDPSRIGWNPLVPFTWNAGDVNFNILHLTGKSRKKKGCSSKP